MVERYLLSVGWGSVDEGTIVDLVHMLRDAKEARETAGPHPVLIPKAAS